MIKKQTRNYGNDLWGTRQTGKRTLLKRMFPEAKASVKIVDRRLKGLRELVRDHPETRKRIVVSLDERDRKTDDGIEILHYITFLHRLWSGLVF